MQTENYLYTELKALLREDEKVFDFIESASLDGMWFWDLENPEHEWMSPGFWTTLGYNPDTKRHLASEWQDIIYQDDLEHATANFKAHCENPNHPYDQVVRYSHKSGKTVWITGASSGIGAGCAQVFAESGANIMLSGRREAALASVADTLKTETLILPFEATDYDQLEVITAQAWDWKPVDILINNAGVSQRSLAMYTAPQVYDDLINIDLIAPIRLTQHNLPRMRDRGGHIVGISSVAGRIGAPLRTAYSAAKHGLIGYLDALRTEVAAPHNIQVTSVLPGSVATNVSRNALTADGSKRGQSDENIDNGASPVDCARAILKAVEDNVPELLYAFGFERDIAELRHTDPDKLFQLVAQLGSQIVADYEAGKDGRTD